MKTIQFPPGSVPVSIVENEIKNSTQVTQIHATILEQKLQALI